MNQSKNHNMKSMRAILGTALFISLITAPPSFALNQDDTNIEMGQVQGGAAQGQAAALGNAAPPPLLAPGAAPAAAGISAWLPAGIGLYAVVTTLALIGVSIGLTQGHHDPHCNDTDTDNQTLINNCTIVQEIVKECVLQAQCFYGQTVGQGGY